MLVKQLLNNSTIELSNISASPRLDAEVLLAYILNKPRSFLYAHDDQDITTGEIEKFNLLVEQRMHGKPIAYLVGHKEFWNLDLFVDENVLIPRPETELLVEIVLQKFPADKNLKIADLGTGSGAIALSLAKERPLWQIFATDNSVAALAVAKRNAEKYAINNVTFCLGNWINALPAKKFDLIVSNPPYIAEGDPHLLQEIRYEPQTALISGAKGLDALTTIIHEAKNVLSPAGMLIFEHGFDQRDALINLMRENGYIDIQCYKDLNECDRVMAGIIEM
jgi:release factor glutamine methyltransferase